MDLRAAADQLSLTQALLLLGGLVLMGLALHGWWQARRLQKRRPLLRTASPDSRQEPGLGPAADHAGEFPASGTGGADPDEGPGAGRPVSTGQPLALDGPLPDGGPDTVPGSRAPSTTGNDSDSGPDTVPGALQPPPRRHAPQLDALIDALVPMSLEAPITGELALLHLPPSRRAGSKPFYIEGLDVKTGQWDSFAPGRRYSELQAGVQLVNRSGALGEIEYSEFVHKVQAFAEAVGASPDVPDMLEAVARARELDSLASPLDAQLSVTLVTREVAWSVAFLQQSAARLGFVPGSVPGRMVVPSAEAGAPPLLVLGFDAHAALADDPQGTALRQCLLMLDVPQSPETAEPFPAWLDAARRLSQALDAEIVDNAGQPITLQAFDGIAGELQDLYRRLQALDLAAGSPAARRLFS
jgi:hypothetical protein